MVPEILKLVLSVSPVPDTKVNVELSPTSTSVALKVPTVASAPAFSATDVELNAISVGASFVLATVIDKLCSAIFVPSVALKVVLLSPTASFVGIPYNFTPATTFLILLFVKSAM